MLKIRILISSCVIFLACVHIYKIIEYPFILHIFFWVNIEHFLSCWSVHQVAIFGYNDFLILAVIEPREMAVINIFYVNPFYSKIIFKFVSKVIPPVGESILTQSRYKLCYSFEHATFNHAEKQIGFFLLWNWLDIELIELCSIFNSCCPNPIFYCLNYIQFTLWTLSSFALLIKTPLTLSLLHYVSWLIFFRWG